MVDVTDIDCKEGDEVIVFETNAQLMELSKSYGNYSLRSINEYFFTRKKSICSGVNMFFKKHLNIFILLIIFLIVEVIINPIGEFCLNDDWVYAASVKTLLSKGVFEIGSWPAMTLYAHVLWGFVFVKLFGFSFTVLRFSILVLSFVTLCITERLFFQMTKK